MTSPQTQDILGKIRKGQLSPREGLAQLKAVGVRLRQFQTGPTETRKQPAEAPDVAIVGMACQFPGAANLDGFWDLLRAGRNAVDVIPAERWDVATYYDADPRRQGKTYSKWGGTLADHHHFDPAFFNLSPREAEFMDPQQRLFLMIAWQALEHAGLADRDLDQRRCGVFVGTGAGDFRTKLGQTGLDANAYAFMGNSDAILSARLSYLLNLRGPTLAIDTACSSSLVAIHLARESICRGETDLAIAGGVTIQTTPQFHIMTSKAGMLSPRGRCHTFADDADGFVPGEGVAVLVLKPLAKAIAERDTIHAVIAGSAINQDGRTNGITAPNAVSQTALELEVYKNFDIHPEQIGYVEAHGTGTKLGDPIEVEALTKAFGTYTSRKQFCAIGSVKSNIGHALSAAGVAGALKAILCLKQRTLVPSLNCQTPNQLIDFAASPFRIATACEPWQAPSDGVRHAAVSSFGFSGTNAHLVLREAPAAPERLVSKQQCFLFVLSAKSETALNTRIRELRDWLNQAESDVRFEDVAFTTLCGRSHLSHRRAWVVRDAQDWFAQLDQAQDGIAVVKQRPDSSEDQRYSDAHLQALGKALHTGSADQATKASMQTLATAYLEGHELSWSLLFADSTARRIPLPTYPFDLKPYNPPEDHGPKKAQLSGHPLVGLNVSTLEAQIYRVPLDASDFYLRDHRAAGRAVFPAAAYLEMARATAALSLTQQPTAILDLHWQLALSVDQPTDVDIEWFALNRADQAAFEVVSYRQEQQRVHASGRVVCTPQKPMAQLDIQAVQQRCPRHVEKQTAYKGLANHGMDYGPSFQLLEYLQASESEVIAELQPATHDGAPWQLHPAVTDSLLQSMLGLLMDDNSAHMWLPTSVAEVVFPGATADASWAYIQAKQKDATTIRFDASLHDQSGGVILAMRDVCVQQLQTAQPAAAPKQALANSQNDTELAKALTTMVTDLAAQVLKVDPSQLDPSDDLTEYGFDSISFTELGDSLSDRLGLNLAPSVFFEHRNLTSFIAFLIEEHHQLVARIFDKTAPTSAAKPQATIARPLRSLKKQRSTRQPQAEEPMAIIGMAGIMPKSPGLNEFWENLKAGRDLISEIPADRWDWRDIDGDPVNETNKCNVRYGGFIAGVDHFDASFFGISPREAEAMDPQQRLFLQSVWHCFEDAGYPPSTFAGKGVGVFAGVANMDYNELWRQRTGEISAHAATGTAHSIVPNRVSYLLDFQGPSEPIDTACSSGLVAVYRAMNAIREGSCEIAVAGGVNVMLTPTLHIAFNKAGMLNPKGACRTFDANANGYVRGEGVGTVLLKPLSKAEADGDHIHAVLLGGALNHGGHATSLTAPNPNAQADLLVQAYTRVGIAADQISYIETHGTGTKLGDPAEVSGLAKAFKQLHRDRGSQAQPQSVALGAVKSNIGHLETAAGVAGLFKVALAMANRTLPANIHFDQLNPYIDLSESPFYIPTESQSWNPCDAQGNPIPRVAGVSSFGFGGAYAHLVLREAATKPIATEWHEPELFVISAKSKASLTATAKSWLDFCQTTAGTANPADVAHTSRIGREAFNVRLACVADSWNSLSQALTAFIENRKHAKCWHSSVAREAATRPTIDGEEGTAYLTELVRKGRLEGLASLWVAGVDLDWQLLAKPDARRVSIPVYAFEKQSFWPPQQQHLPQQRAQALHPLIDANISTLHRQCFQTRLSANHPLLRDHRINQQALLPGTATLEWARAAGSLAAEAQVVALRNLVWIRPISAAAGDPPLRIQISPQEQHIHFDILSANDSVHCQGQILTQLDPHHAANLDLNDLRATCQNSWQAAACYDFFQARGLAYGPGFRVIQEVHFNDHRAVALLQLPENTDGDGYLYHPALLDGMLQTAAILMATGQTADANMLLLPFALEQVTFLGQAAKSCYAIAELDGTPTPENTRLNISLADASGQVLVQFKRFAVRVIANKVTAAKPKPKPVPKPAVAEMGLLCVAREWRTIPQATLVDAQPKLAIFSGSEAMRSSIASERATWVTQVDDVAQVPDLERLVWLRDPELPAKEEFQRGLDLLRKHGNAWARSGCELRYLYLTEDSVAAAMEGFVRVARLEYPGLKFHLIGCSAPDKLEQAALLPLEAHHVHLRLDHELSLQGYRRVELPGETAPNTFDGKTVLITGGMGALGQLFSQDMVKRGARVVLTGRRPHDDAVAGFLAQLHEAGGDAIYQPADLADPDAVAHLIAQAKTQFGAVHAVIHAAGTTADALIAKKTDAQITQVLAAKISGTLNLQTALANEPLAWFALFGSLASVTGNPGQSDYAYANAFLANLAAQSSEQPYAMLCLDWPYWQDGGMRIDQRSLDFVERQTGMLPMPSATGLDVFQRALSANLTNLSLAWGHSERLAAWLQVEAVPQPEVSRAPQSSTATLANADRNKLRNALEEDLLEMAAEILKIDREFFDPEDQMDSYGFDSINLTDLANRLTNTFDLDLLPSVFFEYPTLRAFTDYLVAEHTESIGLHYGFGAPQQMPAEAGEKLGTQAVPLPQPTRFLASNNKHTRHEPIAIVGMSGRLPGGKDLDSFWQNLIAGNDAVSEIPAERWDWRRWYGDPSEGKTRVKSGGFINDVAAFDAGFFGIAPREAKLMDPQHRLVLEAVWSAIEDAGQQPADLSGRAVGLYIGVSSIDYQEILRATQADPHAHELTGNAHSILVNRISYLLNLRGPSEPVDTACSSSLVALHRAVRAIRAGDCDSAIAGGVNLLLSPFVQLAFAKAGMLSPDGHCKTFDKDANGYVRGEGVGALLLKPLSAAQRDGNPIHGLIRGTAVNHGGRANTLVAPNPNAQAEVIVAAIKDAHIPAESISYIEAHGTGTALGDPIEINGLKKAFQEVCPDPSAATIRLGSVKTQIGHLEAAAGIAGVLKVLLSLRHRQLPGNIHLQQANPYIRLQDSPFQLQKDRSDWHGHGQSPLRAGISSFGFGGVNAHIILEAAPEVATPAQTTGPAVFPFSARNQAQLQAVLANFAAAIAADSERTLPPWQSTAYTLQIGREAMACRVAIIASDWQMLRDRLQQAIQGQTGEGLVRSGNTPAQSLLTSLVDGEEGKVYLQALFKAGNLEKLAQLWVGGIAVAWQQLYPEPRPARVSLPTYPFAQVRHWPSEGSPWQPEAASEIVTVAANEPQTNLTDEPAKATDHEAIETFLRAQLAQVAEFDADQIDLDTSLAEMGLDSIFAMELVRQIEAEFGLRLFPNELAEHDTLAKLRDYIAQECSDWQQRQGPQRAAVATTSDASTRPPMLFLLSTPRAGSTLLRTMLMGHTQLFAPPELHLLPFENMAQRRETLEEEGKGFLGEGLLQTLMHLDQLDVEQARAQLTDWENEALPTAQVYAELQARIGQHMLVDKSPSYAESLATLSRAEFLQPAPRYLHLVRHPLSMASSFTKNRFDKMLGIAGDPWTVAFELWQRYNTHLEQFLSTIPTERVFRLRFEDLMQAPHASMQSVCYWLGIPFEAALLDPYAGNRMTEGLHEHSLPIGDPNFAKHKALDPKKANAWVKHRARFTSMQPAQLQQARAYGYATAATAEAEQESIALTPPQACFLNDQHQIPSYGLCHQFTWPEASIDLDRLRWAMLFTLQRHAALSLAFYFEDGLWFQKPQAVTDATIQLHTFEPQVPTQQLRETLLASIDPASGKNLAVAVQMQQDATPEITLAVHHLVTDGVSLGILGSDLKQAYQHPGQAWPKRDDRYLAWAKSLPKLAPAIVEAALAHWRDLVAEPLNVPFDEECEDTFADQQCLYREWPLAALGAREQQHARLAATLFQVIAKWTGQPQPVIALRHHGRSGEMVADQHDVLGWFATDMPLRMASEGPLTTIMQRFNEAYGELSQAPLRYAMAVAQQKLPALHSVAPIRFNFQPVGFNADQGQTTLICEPTSMRDYTLDLIVRVAGQKVRLIARFGARHQQKTIESILDDWLARCLAQTSKKGDKA